MHSYGQRVRKRRRGVEQDVSAAGRAAKVRAYPPQAPRPHAAVCAADPGRAVRQATTRAASQRGDADAAVGGAAPGADGTSLLSSVMRGAESLFSGREGASKAHSATKTAPLDGSREVAPASQGESAGGDGLSQLSEADLVDHSLACLGDIQLNTPCVSPFPRLGRRPVPLRPSMRRRSRAPRAACCDGPARGTAGHGAGEVGAPRSLQPPRGRSRARDMPAWTGLRRTPPPHPRPRRSASPRPTLRARSPLRTSSASSLFFRSGGSARLPRRRRAAR